MKHLIIGHLGEVGRAIYNILQQSPDQDVRGVDLFEADGASWRPDIMHICIPYLPDFVHLVCEYAQHERAAKNFIIIHSTVRPGTTFDIAKRLKSLKVVYSPVRGQHVSMVNDLKIYTKFYACCRDAKDYITNVFAQMNMVSEFTSESYDTLEYCKLANTMYAAVMVNFAQEVAMTAQQYNLDSHIIERFINDTGKTYDGRQLKPYASVIGGHCLIPNTKLADGYHSGILPGIINVIDKMYADTIGHKVSFGGLEDLPRPRKVFREIRRTIAREKDKPSEVMVGEMETLLKPDEQFPGQSIVVKIKERLNVAIKQSDKKARRHQYTRRLHKK